MDLTSYKHRITVIPFADLKQGVVLWVLVELMTGIIHRICETSNCEALGRQKKRPQVGLCLCVINCEYLVDHLICLLKRFAQSVQLPFLDLLTHC